MARLLILGAGVMGSAFAVPAADNGHTVSLVGTTLDDAIIAALKADRSSHPRLNAPLPDAIVPMQFEALTAEDFRRADYVVLGVSSPGVP